MLKTIMLALAAWFAMAGGGGLAQAKGLAPLAAVAPVAACADLARIDLSSATGAPTRQEAKSVAAAGAKPYCQVSGTIAPAIRFEVRLTLGGWTQRYLQTGCGGLCGNLRTAAGGRADEAAAWCCRNAQAADDAAPAHAAAAQPPGLRLSGRAHYKGTGGIDEAASFEARP